MTGSRWFCLWLSVAHLTFSVHHAYLACSSSPLNRIVAHGILHLVSHFKIYIKLYYICICTCVYRCRYFTLRRVKLDLKNFGVNTLVRVCTATYDKAPVEQEGIKVVDWPFDDGSAPPEQVVDDWLHLLQTKFREEPGSCVAVHCVAGLGRAPVLVALALIECGMEYEDAVHFIRLKRRGAFNAKQLLYLENYKPKLCLRSKDGNGQSCCIQ
uniref:Uncharacterized protein n=1 Tax=Periophthalmus magnuspinnatus TaxID=409849 RepID=A0A3B3ZZG1_9GOBI